MADTLAAALWLAERSLHVFDLDHPELPRCVGVRTREHDPAACTERGKHPCGAWSKQATTDREQITAMFVGATRNIGIACGPSGLLVVDEDVIGELARFCESIGQTVPDTFRVRTGKGWHFYFRQPAGAQLGNSEGALRGYGVNVRGVGGYVVGPGSTHASGEVYMPADVNAEILPCPSWLVDALTGKTGQAGDDPFAFPAAAKDHSWWRDVETIHHPNRHNALFAAAGWCRAMGIARDDAVTVVRDVWRRCCPGTCCRDGNPAKPYTWELAAARLEDAYERYEAGRDLPPRDDDESDAEYERRAHHARRVATEVDRLQVIDEAREILDRARRGEVPPFDADLLDSVLARPAEPPDRIEGLLPTDGRLLVVAQRKTGKTTFGLNLARWLIDGGHFLGRFAVRPIAGNIAVLNYEVTGRQLAKWAHDVGIPGDRLLLVNLRGRLLTVVAGVVGAACAGPASKIWPKPPTRRPRPLRCRSLRRPATRTAQAGRAACGRLVRLRTAGSLGL